MAKRSVVTEDFFRFQLVSDVQISPDGAKTLFVVKRIDRAKNRYVRRLYLADNAAGKTEPFSGDQTSDSSPRWSPDGSQIAFLSDRSKPVSQIHLLSASGGEARALTQFAEEGSISDLAWSPDGSKIAFLYTRNPAGRTEKAAAERKETGASLPVRVHTKLFYRLDGVGYFDGELPQIAVADVMTGEVRILTNEPHHLGAPTWSPDSKTLAFAGLLDEFEDLTSNIAHIYKIPAEGGEIERIAAPDGPKEALSWSPDGQWFAYVGHLDTNDAWGCRNSHVLLLPAAGADKCHDLLANTDKHVGYSTTCDLHDIGAGSLVAWAPDSLALYFPVSERGEIRLYRVGINGGGVAALTPHGHEVGSFSISGDEKRVAVQIGTATDPHDLFVGEAEGAELALRRVSHINSALLEEIEFQPVESVEVPNSSGGKVHTFVLRPPGFDPSKSYPCVLSVHGGPAMQYAGSSSPYHELQSLASEGFVVLFANPRGSKGYGDAHCAAIRGNWGTVDWEDVQAVADYGAGLAGVDGSRMAIMGGSYGGYMTAWAVGHTDRFACAIADRLVNNLHSMAGTCDFPWSHGNFYKGNAWDDPSDLWRASPLKYAGNVQTPLLLIHSDGDLRCPVSQAEELFTALRWQRKTVEFVRYSAESSHGLSRNGPPDLRLDRMQRNLEWLTRWLKG